MREIFFIKERCLPGCRACYAACIAEHSGHKEDYGPIDSMPLARKRMSEELTHTLLDPLPHAARCHHCPDAPCVEVCISGSMQQDAETGRVFNDETKCVGCWMCVMVCPYSALIPIPDRRKVLKCDSCLALDDPVCVRVCPTGALIYCEPDDFRRYRKAAIRFNEERKPPLLKVFG